MNYSFLGPYAPTEADRILRQAITEALNFRETSARQDEQLNRLSARMDRLEKRTPAIHQVQPGEETGMAQKISENLSALLASSQELVLSRDEKEKFLQMNFDQLNAPNAEKIQKLQHHLTEALRILNQILPSRQQSQNS